MFGKTDNDISRTLGMMIERSVQECRFNQGEAIKKTAEWIRQDRRFDAYDSNAVAREAFDARSHGRRLQLDKAPQVQAMAPTYTGR